MKKRAQVWVETAIYTLIALAIIGMVLTFARPKIQEIQDKSIIDQTLNVMKTIDEQIFSVKQGGVGNKRVVELELKKGEIKINSDENKIVYTLEETRSKYSEIGRDVAFGDITIKTIKTNKGHTVTLTLDYEEDLIGDVIITKSSTPYKLSITNKGKNQEGENKIKIEVV